MAASAQRPLRVWERLARAGGIGARSRVYQGWGHQGETLGLPGLGAWGNCPGLARAGAVEMGWERGGDSPSPQASVSHLSREYG